MGEMRILGPEGDIKLDWDPNDSESVDKAKTEFKRLKEDGYDFFAVEETKGKRVERFDKKIGKLIAAPGSKTKADKTAGTRPKAMAGGPNTNVSRPLR